MKKQINDIEDNLKLIKYKDQLNHFGGIYHTLFSPDGKYISAGLGQDGTIKLWDVNNGELIQHLNTDSNISINTSPKDSGVMCIAFSPDSRYILAGFGNGKIKAWEAQTGIILKELSAINSGTIYDVAFSFDGKYILSGSYDGIVRLWDTKTDNVLQELKGWSGDAFQNIVQKVAFSSDGKYIISGSNAGVIRLWDTKTGDMISATKAFKAIQWFSTLKFNSDSSYIIGSDANDGIVKLYETETGKMLREIKAGYSLDDQYMGSITCVVFSPSGKYIVSGVYNGIVRLYETETGKMLREIKCPFTKINSMEFSEDGEHLLLSDLDKDEVKINFNQGVQDIINPEITLFKEYNKYKNDFIQIEEKKDLEEEPMLKLEKKTSPKVEKDLLENKAPNYQKNSFLENIKREINTVKSLFSVGVDKQDILKEIGFLTESNLDYIIQHLDDTDVDILGKLE